MCVDVGLGAVALNCVTTFKMGFDIIVSDGSGRDLSLHDGQRVTLESQADDVEYWRYCFIITLLLLSVQPVSAHKYETINVCLTVLGPN